MTDSVSTLVAHVIKPKLHYADFRMTSATSLRRDKPMTSPLGQIPLCRLSHPGKTQEVGVMEFWLKVTSQVRRGVVATICCTSY